MNKKMGPLKMWQWIAIGVVTGAAWYLYKRSHPEAANPEEIVGAVAGGVPSGGGSEGGGSGGGGLAGPLEIPIPLTPEAPAPTEPLPNLIQEPGPFAEGLLAKIFNTENERRSAAQTNARKAHKQAAKARAAARKEHKARVKAEHRQHRKPKSTGGAAHQAQTHHTPAHPSTRVGRGGGVQAPPKRHRQAVSKRNRRAR